MAAVVRIPQSSVLRRLLFLSNTKHIRLISTSKKNSETATVVEPLKEKVKTEAVAEKKNWVSYGFDFENQESDRNALHSTLFFSVTCCLVFGGFILSYLPDFQNRDWAQREAFLELRRRESEGLPLIDRNLLDPDSISLPSDEELGETEVII
ncbi:NADH dehydrogenase [ubiquinone] 1 beta subcomplex subunit 11, mitochondrial [Anabrus simplex]|uniref:NADH dehydrogenase [ubiquinone] 1 beta subcomplex subunit 11, mitochondrial n=1 Tax=Anabrus simplex TaxID=316456 RepID=UPI0034DDB8DE